MSEGTATIKINAKYLYIDKDAINKTEILEWISNQIPGTWVIETIESIDSISYALSKVIDGVKQPALPLTTDSYLVLLESLNEFGITRRLNCLSAHLFLNLANLD